MTAKVPAEGELVHTGTAPSDFQAVTISRLVESSAECTSASASLSPKLGALDLWLFNIARPPLAIEQLRGVLNKEERQRAERFHFAEHRSRFVAAHGVMRFVLSACGAGAAEELAFIAGAYNKPRLQAPQDGPTLSFNLSHSGDWALLAVAPEGEIGADIEKIRPLDRMEILARDTFAPSEYAALAALDQTRRLDGFFACWTRKEALVKADGRGLDISLNDFGVNVDPDAAAELLRATGTAEAINSYGIWNLPPIQGYRAAVAAPRGSYDFKYFCIV
jgi:4'-phosphopantetheinyl transferase